MPSPHSSSRLAQSAALHRSHCSFFGTLLLHERFNDVPLFLSQIPAGIHSKESGLIRRIPANRVIRSYSSILFLGTEYQWPALVGVEIGEIGSLLHDISFHFSKNTYDHAPLNRKSGCKQDPGVTCKRRNPFFQWSLKAIPSPTELLKAHKLNA